MVNKMIDSPVMALPAFGVSAAKNPYRRNEFEPA